MIRLINQRPKFSKKCSAGYFQSVILFYLNCMINLFKPRTWSRYYNDTSEIIPAKLETTYKRDLLLSQLTMIALLFTVVHLILDLIKSPFITAVLDMIIIIVFFVTYRANEAGKNAFAKIFLAISMNLMLFIYANIIPKENGLNFLFIPLVSLYFVIFKSQEYLKRLMMVALTIGIFLILEITNYNLLNNVNKIQEIDTLSYALNFISSIIILSISFNFLIQSNHKAEEKLTRQSLKILEQNHDLEKTNRELDLFVYRSSHDIKAPLASIQGLVNLMKMEGGLTENQNEYIIKIQDRVSKLETFISEITKYSRNVRLELQLEPIDIGVLIQEVIISHRYFKSADSIKTIVDDQINQPIMVDKSRLLTIVNNLYSNAIKYHDPYQADPAIWITFSYEKDQFHMKIADNGPGIPPEVQTRIFDMFYRGNEASDGSGLGLFIAKEVIEKLHGHISVASNKPKGTVFTLNFPATLADEPPTKI